MRLDKRWLGIVRFWHVPTNYAALELRQRKNIATYLIAMSLHKIYNVFLKKRLESGALRKKRESDEKKYIYLRWGACLG